ncbi:MAG: penicillin-binding protein 1A [Leptolyngbyaceae cyanobacterium bins.59]|nr:penicillin-binding protein 1A [Leptolyngbyaceae cyanobacterium bins.59]
MLTQPLRPGVKARPDAPEVAADSPEEPTPPPEKKRLRRRTRYLRYLSWLILGLVVSGGGVVTWVWYDLEQSLPDVTDVFTFVRDGTITIRSADGKILQQKGPATREKLSIQKIPRPLIQAFLSVEDRRFYEHDGVDYQGVLRAIVSNVTAGEVVEGASTVTQQLARMVFLTQEQSVWRKLKEAMLARKIEERMGKEHILERYLNLVYLGSGAYGVADAAWVYFGKKVDQLTLPEVATIAGLPPAPSDYSPLVNPEAAKSRRNIVLQRMADEGYITEVQAEKAQASPLVLKPKFPKRLIVEAPYFTTYIQQELPRYVSRDILEEGGLIVETSLNSQWQKLAERVIKEAIEVDGPGQSFAQAAMVAIDPQSGEVKAMVGGNDFQKSQFNRVTQAQRQPGSTFKTFLYTAAIAAGFSPYDGYQDAPLSIGGYQPQNASRRYYGWMNLREALTQSINVIAVRVLLDVGFDPVIKMAKDMGIQSKMKPVFSLALGSNEATLLEITSGYGTLAARGVHVPVHGIRRVLNRRGEVLYDASKKLKPKQVVDKGSAAIVTWMLRGVVESGTGANAYLPGRPVAGKTGTSEEARDLWFIGYIPQIVTGVWLGNDNNDPTWGASSTAALVWHRFMSKIVVGMKVQKFPPLPSLEGRKGSIKAKPYRGEVRAGKADPSTYSEPAPRSEPERPVRERGAVDVDRPAPSSSPESETPHTAPRDTFEEPSTREEPVPQPPAPAEPAPAPMEPPPPVTEELPPPAAPAEPPPAPEGSPP